MVALWAQAGHLDLWMENSREGTEVPARVRARTSSANNTGHRLPAWVPCGRAVL